MGRSVPVYPGGAGPEGCPTTSQGMGTFVHSPQNHSRYGPFPIWASRYGPHGGHYGPPR